MAYFSTEYRPEAMVQVIDQLLNPTSAVDDLPPPQPLVVTAIPNPFNPRTTIRFTLTQAGPVSLNIHDARGRLVRSLADGQEFLAGPVALSWDGTSKDGRSAAAGAYLVRLVTAQGETTHKITLLK